jgi:hypothetical protein
LKTDVPTRQDNSDGQSPSKYPLLAMSKFPRFQPRSSSAKPLRKRSRWLRRNARLGQRLRTPSSREHGMRTSSIGEAYRRWRGKRSEPVRLGVRDHHTRSLCAQSPAQSEQWCCWFGRRRSIFGLGEISANSCLTGDAAR